MKLFRRIPQRVHHSKTNVVRARFAILSIGLALSQGCRDSKSPDDQSGAPPERTISTIDSEAVLPVTRGGAWEKIDDPAGDGWETEAFNAAAGKQLKELGEAIAHGGPIDVRSLAAIAAEDVRYTDLVPTQFTEAYRSTDLVVQRGEVSSAPSAVASEGLEGFAKALGELSAPSEKCRIKFKIFRVRPDGEVCRHSPVPRIRQLREGANHGAACDLEDHLAARLRGRRTEDRSRRAGGVRADASLFNRNAVFGLHRIRSRGGGSLRDAAR